MKYCQLGPPKTTKQGICIVVSTFTLCLFQMMKNGIQMDCFSLKDQLNGHGHGLQIGMVFHWYWLCLLWFSYCWGFLCLLWKEAKEKIDTIVGLWKRGWWECKKNIAQATPNNAKLWSPQDMRLEENTFSLNMEKWRKFAVWKTFDD